MSGIPNFGMRSAQGMRGIQKPNTNAVSNKNDAIASELNADTRHDENNDGTTVTRVIEYEWDGDKWVPKPGGKNDGVHKFGDEILDFNNLERVVDGKGYSCTENELEAILNRRTGEFS